MNKKGSNQYLKTPKHNSLKYLWVFLGLVASLVLTGKYIEAQENKVQAQIMSPVPELQYDYGEIMPKGEDETNYTQEEIEKYVKVIFGRDAKRAIEVSYHECAPWYKAYPECINKSKIEWSCGLFQINLENPRHKVHFEKVPGETTNDKCIWLLNPYHNTLVAFKIFKDSGFWPWSWYSKEGYKLYE